MIFFRLLKKSLPRSARRGYAQEWQMQVELCEIPPESGTYETLPEGRVKTQ